MGLNTLVKTSGNPNTVAGGPKMPHVQRLGMLYQDIFIQDYKVALL